MSSTISKLQLHAEILRELEAELAMLLKAAEAAYEGAVHGEAISKSKYETHGLELSYLAGSHFERAMALRRSIQAFRAQEVRNFGDHEPIALGALVTLEEEGKQPEHMFLCAVGAGLLISLAGHSIQVTTPFSPLGKQLLESAVGDQIEIKSRPTPKKKLIVAIC